MVKTSHNKTIRIDAADTYLINSDNETIIINTNGAVIIKFPHMLKDNDRINIISLVATPNVTVNDFANVLITTLTTDYGYIQVEYNTSADAYVSRELVGGGAPVDTGWSLSGFTTTLGPGLGIAIDEIATTSADQNYFSVVDASLSDVNEDLTLIEGGQRLIKQIKVIGSYNLILASTIGFSDGSNSLIISDSAIIFFDTANNIWQILYNNYFKTKVVNISSAEILSMGTTPIELLPAPGVGKFYDVKSVILKFTFGSAAYTLGTDLCIYFPSLGFVGATFAELVNNLNDAVAITKNPATSGSNGYSYGALLNEAFTLSTLGSDDPTLGDGTIQVIIKYKVNTF